MLSTRLEAQFFSTELFKNFSVEIFPALWNKGLIWISIEVREVVQKALGIKANDKRGKKAD
jgi:hypothetical protein